MGSFLVDGFAIEVTAEAAAPGMIGGRHIGGFELMVQGFGVNHLGLADRFVENGVGQGFVLVEDSYVSLGIFAYGHLGVA